MNVSTIARWLLGLILLFFGANGLFNFMTPPPPKPAVEAFWNGLMSTGYFLPFMSVVMLVVGLMLVLNKWVPLALVILAPISVQIILFHVFLDLGTIVPGLVVTALNVYLGIVNFDAYRPMFEH